MKVTTTLEDYLEDMRLRATATLGWLDAHSPESTQVDYVEGYHDAIRQLAAVLPDFRESEANALSEDLRPSWRNPL